MILFNDEIKKDIPDYMLASKQFRDFLNGELSSQVQRL